MHQPFTTLFGERWYSYSVLFMVGTALTLAWLVYRAPEGKRVARIDVFISGLVGSVVVGRVVHVILQWQYFVDRTREIYEVDLEGGLNWHGMVIGALIAMLIMARIRKVEMRALLDDMALILPILALFGWWACGTIACAYGAPVERMADYPRGITWLEPDIFGIVEPRFATQRLGVIASILAFIVIAILHRKDWLRGARVWVALILISIGSFGIGYLRGDFIVMHNTLRADQWLDLAMIGFAGIGIIFNLLHRRTTTITNT